MKFLLLGTCQIGPIFLAASQSGHEVDHHILGCKPMDDVRTANLKWPKYDACIIAPVIRQIIREVSGQTNELIFWRLDAEGVERLGQACLDYLAERLLRIEALAAGKPCIVISFIEPSTSYVGSMFRFEAEYDFKHFVNDLNRRVKFLLKSLNNFWFLDCNPILDGIGRTGFQDDNMAASSHAAFVGDWDHDADQKRIVPPSRPTDLFQAGDRFVLYGRKVIEQIEHILYAIGQNKKIKLIICDLDDTLWRGIAAEDDITPIFRAEGWPFGLVEALLVFKKRGGMLAICSKNGESKTLERFKVIWREVITIDDFASVRINWNAKSENVAQILRDTNTLPQHALFIDDNPREVDEVRQVFPDMNFYGFDHYLWRGDILNRPEMLVPVITQESAAKTQLVQAKIGRDRTMDILDRGDWLTSLKLAQRISTLNSIHHRDFARVLELINKTNQFNTNGVRWTSEELAEHFAAGGYLIASHLSDIHADNGLIGVVVIRHDVILQAVLSCRVFNLGAEAAMMHAAVRAILADHVTARGSIVPTGLNFVCHDLYRNLGFEAEGDEFSTATAPQWPPWISDISPAEPVAAPLSGLAAQRP